MQKSYTRINWENYPSENTPLNESNLNRMDYALNEVDDRVIALDTDKATVTEISTLIEDVSVDDETGIITVTKQNGQEVQIQTTLNKIAVNFSYDYNTQSLILTMNDGTQATISLATLIQNNEFTDTDTIAMSVSPSGLVSSRVVLHSITDEHLRTDYLADIRTSEAHANAYQAAAEGYKFDSEAWAKGTRNGVEVTSQEEGFKDNSKFYKQRAEAWAVGHIDGSNVPNTDETFENNAYYYSQLTESLRDATSAIRDDAADLLQAATDRLTGLNIIVNYNDGCLYYDINSGIQLTIDYNTGELLYDVI